MSADRDLQDKLTPLISLLKRALYLRVHAIQNEILRAADFSRFKDAVLDAPRPAKPLTTAFAAVSGRHSPDYCALDGHSFPALPRHVTFEVSGGLIAMLEFRLDARVKRLHFYTKASGVTLLQMLVEQGSISASDQVALATRIRICSLPESIESALERLVTVEASIEEFRHVADGLLQWVLLLKVDPIKEQREWIM